MLHLIRHGQGYHNVAGTADPSEWRSWAWEDAGLTEVGWEQARRLGEHVRALEKRRRFSPELVVVSPLYRTLETAVGVFGREEWTAEGMRSEEERRRRSREELEATEERRREAQAALGRDDGTTAHAFVPPSLPTPIRTSGQPASPRGAAAAGGPAEGGATGGVDASADVLRTHSSSTISSPSAMPSFSLSTPPPSARPAAAAATGAVAGASAAHRDDGTGSSPIAVLPLLDAEESATGGGSRERSSALGGSSAISISTPIGKAPAGVGAPSPSRLPFSSPIPEPLLSSPSAEPSLGDRAVSPLAALSLASPVVSPTQSARSSPLGSPRNMRVLPLMLPQASSQSPTRTAVPGTSLRRCPPFLAVELFREHLGVHPCDRRRPLSETSRQFPGVDFSLVESDEDVHWDPEVRESAQELERRGAEALAWLAERPEREIAVVSHGGLLWHALVALGKNAPHAHATPPRWFENCEMRTVVLSIPEDAGDDPAGADDELFGFRPSKHMEA